MKLFVKINHFDEAAPSSIYDGSSGPPTLPNFL